MMGLHRWLPGRRELRGRIRHVAMAAGLALGSAASLAITAGTTAHAAGSSIPVGQPSPFTVPANIYALHVVLVGGSGAFGSTNHTSSAGGGSGGRGAQVVADLPVHPGDPLAVN